jgi:hypothetical protein
MLQGELHVISLYRFSPATGSLKQGEIHYYTFSMPNIFLQYYHRIGEIKSVFFLRNAEGAFLLRMIKAERAADSCIPGVRMST